MENQEARILRYFFATRIQIYYLVSMQSFVQLWCLFVLLGKVTCYLQCVIANLINAKRTSIVLPCVGCECLFVQRCSINACCHIFISA